MKYIKAIIIASRKDMSHARRLAENLAELGVQIKNIEDLLNPGGQFFEQIASIIAEEKNIIFFISENSVRSKYLMDELSFAYGCAKERDKKIISIVKWKNLLENNPALNIWLASQQIIFPDDGLYSKKDYIDTAGIIYDIISNSENKELLYEKIANLSKIKYYPGISSNLCQLIHLLCNELSNERDSSARRNIYKELLRCMEQLVTCGESGYSDEDRKLAHKRLDAIDEVNRCTNNSDFQRLDMYLISFVLLINYYDYRIRNDVIDTLTNGDTHGVGPEMLADKYLSRQDFYYKIYNTQLITEGITETNHGKYSEDEIAIIFNVKNHLILDKVGKSTSKSVVKQEISESDKRLHAIADYMRQSNKLFELAGNQNLAIDFLKCLKTSYERLRKYSEIVGCLEICAECIERIAEINQSLEITANEQSDGSMAETGIKALLGVSLADLDDFDVFISYKHEDADIAESIYHYLKSNLIYPFFDSVTLPELSKSEYEDAIMNAIEHSKHFIVVISDLNYLASHWVELEMKTFRHEMVEGRKSAANFIIIVTNDVYENIISTNKQCLPIKYRSYEIMQVTEYKNSISKYLK